MSAPATQAALRADAAVFVHLAPDPLVDAEREWQWLASLEESLAAAVALARAGKLEAIDLIGDEWVLSAYGPSVDALWTAMSKILAEWPLPANSYALHRHGGAGAPEQRVTIGGADSGLVPARRSVPATWRPVSEQGLLAALATISSAA